MAVVDRGSEIDSSGRGLYRVDQVPPGLRPALNERAFRKQAEDARRAWAFKRKDNK